MEKICRIEDCGRTVNCRDLCSGHYERWRTGKDLDKPITRRHPKECIICRAKSVGFGYCQKHYRRYKTTGDPLGLKIGERGKGTVDENGYIRIYDARRKKRSFQHRDVMEQFLGRKLDKRETIHHKNGKREDNRIENLEVRMKAHGPGQRIDDLIEWLLTFHLPSVERMLNEHKSS